MRTVPMTASSLWIELHTWRKFDRPRVFGRLNGLTDCRAVAYIDVRIKRLVLGYMGDVKGLGDGVSEPRIHHGPGYRADFTRRGERIVRLLCDGVKKWQNVDIAHVKRLAKKIRNDG